MSENRIPRMRTADQAAAYIKEMDPDTKVTAYRIRKMIFSGEIPHIVCGRNKLINLDLLLQHLSGVPEPEPKKEETAGQRIRSMKWIRRTVV